jgi:tetratricopeptide (TPR) repeat protein
MAIHKAAERDWGGRAAGIPVKSGIHAGQFLVGRLGRTVEIDQDAKRPAWAFLDTLVADAEVGTIIVSEAAAPFLERRFELIPVAREGTGGSPYRLGRATGTGFERRLGRFVGRQHEVELLRGLLATATRGQGQVVGIVGEPGIGKSRLLFEFRQSLAGEPVAYLEGHCVSYGATIPYLPVLDLLRDNCGITESDTPEATRAKVHQTLAELGMDAEGGAPYLLHLLGVKEGGNRLQALPPEVINARTFQTLRQMSLRGSRRRPIILVVEDLHWIDKTSEEYLASLVESFVGAPILFIATYRPGYRPPWIDKSYTTQVALQPLAPPDSRSLVRSAAGTAEVADALVELILSKGEGNPFFLEELTRAVREQGDRSPTFSVPDTVEAVLQARIDWLTPEQRQLLECASVIGKDVPLTLLHAASGLTEEAVRRLLEALKGAEFLYERSLAPELEYTFKHSLTHEVAYQGLLPDRRRRLHARIVEAMELRYPDGRPEQIERLARHAFAGQVWDKATLYLRQAGANAAARSAHREAVACFEQALEALQHFPASRDRTEQGIDLRLDLRHSLFPLGAHGRILGHLREAQGLAEALEDRRRLGWVLCNLSHCFRVMGDHDRATDAGQRALAIAGDLGDVTLELETRCYLGQAYYLLGEYGQAAGLLRRCVAALEGELIREHFGLPALLSVFSRTWLAWCLAEQGTFAEGRGFAEQAVRIAEAADHPYSLTVACYGLGAVHLRSGELAAAIAVLERGRDLCRADPLPMLFSVTALHLGYAYALSDRVAEGVSLLEAAVGQVATMGMSAWHSIGLAWLGEAYWRAGRGEAALAQVGQALELSRARGERGYHAWALRLLGEIHAGRDSADLSKAETCYRDALERAEGLGMRPLAARSHLELGLLYRRTGRRPESRSELAAAVALFRSMDMPGGLAWAEAAEGRSD